MRKIILILITMIVFAMPFVFAVQPTQQYNKIFLTPFYRASMTNNLNYTYSVAVQPPDGISSVKSAILSFDIYITPTVTFSAWVNNKSCNTPSYQVSTTYASQGQGRITFDCSNVINKAGIYSIVLKITQANAGASTGWLDLTYMNNPRGNLDLHGTEYTYGQRAKIWLQLLDASGNYVNEGVCYIHIYTPNNEEYIENAEMLNQNHDGIYYYDIDVPLETGVYPAIASCYYLSSEIKYYPLSIGINRGTAVFSNLDAAYEIDGDFFRYTENSPSPRRIDLNWTFTASNISACSLNKEELMTGINVYVYGLFDSVVNDDVSISIYNWTSDSWVSLPNKILEGPGYKSVSNFLLTNNITKSGYYSNTNGMEIRTNDTTLTDGTNTNFDVDQIYIGCSQLQTPVWQEIKGSSEMHVTSDKLYIIQFDSFSFSPEKINYYNITVGSKTSSPVNDIIIDIPIYYAYICGAIKNVSKNINGTYQAIDWSYSKAKETILDSCNVLIEEDLQKGQNYEYSITFDDKWQEYSEARLSRVNYLDEYIRAGCEFYRLNFGYPAYDIPLTLIPNSSYGKQYSVCHYYFDSYYSMNKSVTENIINKFSIAPVVYTEEKDVKQVEADVLEIASITDQLLIVADAIIQEWVVANSYSTTILGNTNITPSIIQYWSNISSTWAIYNKNTSENATEIALKVWNISDRQLTAFNFNVTANINETSIANQVWNHTGTINDNILTSFATKIWNYASGIYTGILGQISNSIWNNTQGRNLTYYAPASIDNDVTSEYIWNYTARYTHGEVLTP